MSGEVPRPSGSERRRRKRIWIWLRLCAALAILWWVIRKNGQGRILETLAGVRERPWWVVLAALLFFCR